jgi:hypothetical protein
VSKYNLTHIKFPNKLIPKNTLRRNIMGDILKEAIADAKAVRETALENAKMALEEAFTPQIKSMLSAKLKEEEDDEVEEFGHDEKEEGEHEEGEHEEGEEREEGEHDDEAEEGEREEGEHDDEAEEGEREEGEHDDEDEVEEGNLDLEAIIKELESELTEDDDEDDAEEGMRESDEIEEGEEIEEEYEIDEAALTEEDDEDDKDEVDEELDKSSGIGKGDNKEDNTDVSSGIGGGKKGMKESSAIEAELKEYKEAVSFLKDKLHEVNILNAKLLFTNKLFKAYSLDNNQKLKVVETFDRAQTTREIKLVYSTLAEQFGDNGSIVTKKSISESASTAVASTKPSKESRKVISEETNVADRFRKLAGLIK